MLGEVWEDPKCRSFCLCGVGVYHTPGTWMCSQIWKLLETDTIGICMEVSSHRHNWSLTPFLAPLHSQEPGGWGWKFQASNHGLVFPVTIPHPGASRSPPRVISLAQKTFLSLRKLQGFQKPYVRNQGQRLSIRTKDFPRFLSLRKFCTRNENEDQISVSYYKSPYHRYYVMQHIGRYLFIP